MAAQPERRRTAGAFDIRTIIAALFVIYGAVLTIMGLAGGSAETHKAAGIDINLWSGIGMLAFSGVLALWVWLRPLVVTGPPEESSTDGE